MPADPNTDKFAWLLGREKYQRLYMQYWLMTSLVYLLIVLLGFLAVAVGLMSIRSAEIGAIGVLSGLAVFFVALRSGWSRRFRDPTLTAAQMAYALVMVSVSYVLSPNLRVVQVMVAPLILLFGAFTLSPRQCWQMAGFAMGLQAMTAVVANSLDVSNGHPVVEWLVLFGCVIVFSMTAAMAGRLSAMRVKLRSQKKELNEALERNLMLVRQDSLTSLPNRRYAMELLGNEEQRALRQRVIPSVCMLDIDHFKRINDTYGHAVGDDVLRLFAVNANAAVRAIDVLTRWGGEEFLLLMPHTSMDEALQVIDRVRRQLAQPGVWQARPELQVTFSAGIAVYHADETIMQTVARADEALYAAKLKGRNCTVTARQDGRASD